MYDALGQVKEQFDLYWGQTLLNALRALHGVRSAERNDPDEEHDAEDDFLD